MKILCFGDSNTYGYDPRGFFGGQYPRNHRWVDLLADYLGCNVVNAGENGREIPVREGDLLRFDLMLRNQKPLDLLIVLLGDNDLLQGNSVETVTGRMEYFLRHVDLQRQNILLLGPPPMTMGQWVSSQDLIDASNALKERYRALSARLGVRFADAGDWNIPMCYDGVHFTEEGHRAFAKGLFDVLKHETGDFKDGLHFG